MNISEREREVLQLLCQGLSTKQIAGQTDLSHTNTRQIVSKLLSKFNCSNNVSLAIYAKEHILTNVRATKKRR